MEYEMGYDKGYDMGKIYVIGIGPGDRRLMTDLGREALDKSDVIVGYKVYIDLIREDYPEKEFLESGMREEILRCEKCIALAREGKTVSLICSGDAGVYGMASPLLEVAEKEGFMDVEIIPGVTAALAGAAILGAAGLVVKILGAVFRIPLTAMLGGSGMGYFSCAYGLFLPVFALIGTMSSKL